MKMTIEVNEDDLSKSVENRQKNIFLNDNFCRIYHSDEVGQVMIYVSSCKGSKTMDTILVQFLDQNSDLITSNLGKDLDFKGITTKNLQIIVQKLTDDFIDIYIHDVIKESIMESGLDKLIHKFTLLCEGKSILERTVDKNLLLENTIKECALRTKEYGEKIALLKESKSSENKSFH